MKKIGFIDYYISEWHANKYPKWIAAACESLGVDYKVGYVWAELDRSPIDGVSTSEWCEKYGAEQCASIAELCEKSDAVIILAPSDPDRHLGYAREALPFARRAEPRGIFVCVPFVQKIINKADLYHTFSPSKESSACFSAEA